MTRYKSAVQKRNAAVLLRKPGRLASQYATKHGLLVKVYVFTATVSML